MKKIICLSVTIFIILFVAISLYRGANLSKQFDRLAITDFNAIEITVNGRESRYNKGTNEYKLFILWFLDLQQSTHSETSVLQRGEAKKGVDITLYNDEEILSLVSKINPPFF